VTKIIQKRRARVDLIGSFIIMDHGNDRRSEEITLDHYSELDCQKRRPGLGDVASNSLSFPPAYVNNLVVEVLASCFSQEKKRCETGGEGE
jgi:hypothetical protein